MPSIDDDPAIEVRSADPPTTGDRRRAIAIVEAAERSEGRTVLSDHVRIALADDESPLILVLSTRTGADPDDAALAFAVLAEGNDERAMEIVMHPEAGDRALSIEARLVPEALRAVTRGGGGRVNWWRDDPDDEHHALAQASGFTVGRTLYQMRRPLPLDAEAEVPTRAFVPGQDDEQWLRVNNRAFAGHGEQGGWTPARLRSRIAEPWFDAAGFRIHERDGRIAAFCWTKVHPPGTTDEIPLGEIYVIAVDPDFHGAGLGRQLTLAGLDHLAGQGLATAMLYVDAANEAAVGLYRRLGFEVHTERVAFAADVPDDRANGSETPG